MFYRAIRIKGIEYQIAVNISGKGAPTTSTEGTLGMVYMDEDTGDLYRCISAADTGYIWKKVADGGEIDATLTQSGKAADAAVVGEKFDKISKEIANLGGTLVEPAEDDIPKVFFNGDTTNMSKTNAVDLGFEYRSKTATYSGTANVKWQGSSSLSNPEKNYTVKLYKDVDKTEKLKLDIKGWGAENKFCLKANYVDTLHLRNIVGARIAYDMIKSRSDFDSLPTEMREAPRCGVIDGFPIKVFINGVLQGIYTWNIPKDKWQMNMDDENPNHAFLMAEKNNNGNSATTDPLVLACEFRANATIFADTSDVQYPPYDWVVEAPGDDVSSDIRVSFNALINCVKDTDDETFKATIGEHLDLMSAFDYYSFAYLMCHYDGLAKNLGMATYDGIKWFCILYDMDSTFGAKIDGSAFLATNRKCPEEYQETNSLLWQRIETCFGKELYARYLELRSGALSMANILTHAERFYDSIPTEYYTEDRSIWTSKPSQGTNTITRLRNYIVQRAKYVDAEMMVIGSEETGGEEIPDETIPCTEITLSTNTLTFNGNGTQVITANVKPENTTDTVVWSSDNTNVAVVTDGVVRAIGNGSATITATCGTQFASCSVYVSGLENLIAGITWSAGYLDNSNGNQMASTKDKASSAFNVEQYVGKQLLLEVNKDSGIIPSDSSNPVKIAYYDKNSSFIEMGLADNIGTLQMVTKVPETAITARLSVYSEQVDSVYIYYVDNNLAYINTAEQIGAYDVVSGNVQFDESDINSHYAIVTEPLSSKYLYNKVWDIIFVDANDALISNDYNLNRKNKLVATPSEAVKIICNIANNDYDNGIAAIIDRDTQTMIGYSEVVS